MGERAATWERGEAERRRGKGKDGGTAANRSSTSLGCSGAARGATGGRGCGAAAPPSWRCAGAGRGCWRWKGGEWSGVRRNGEARFFYRRGPAHGGHGAGRQGRGWGGLGVSVVSRACCGCVRVAWRELGEGGRFARAVVIWAAPATSGTGVGGPDGRIPASW